MAWEISEIMDDGKRKWGVALPDGTTGVFAVQKHAEQFVAQQTTGLIMPDGTKVQPMTWGQSNAD